ncbi:MAG TPA: putative LPS assembly protein LptD [Amoebophilaceae bacterium]|nr:putative LPS assembly protein LptD [Amoebophilaceae bacterium]
MTKTCFIRKVGIVALCISFSTLLLKATQFSNTPPYTKISKETGTSPIQPLVPIPHAFKNRGDTPYTRVRKRLFPSKEQQWLFLKPKPTQPKDQPLAIVHYQAEEAIVFDARNNQLLLQGTGVLEYDTMKLEAACIALDLSARTITAEGTKDRHEQWVGSPIFTFKDAKKGKYGKAGITTTRTFFMEKIRYNIDTKRALVNKLTTKQEESIIKTEQTKKEDEETFYAQDLTYTTCGLRKPHFYIRTKQAKMVQDQHITSGPFRFYFDDVPTPLGFFFGALFLEGKRTHGIIPPEIGEEDENGFYLRNGGYYINFKDYADLSMIGSIYSNGVTELKNELRYKKRYLCNGTIGYNQNRGKKEKGWALSWSHTTLTHRTRSFNARVNLRNKGYRTFDKKEETALSKKTTNQSSGSVTYKDKLIGLPYQLTLRTKYEKNLLSNFTHATLPAATLQASWYPLKRGVQREQWFQKLQVKHTIDFQNHFKNAVQDPFSVISIKKTEEEAQVPTTASWNQYAATGVLHTFPFSLDTKLFEYLNATPNFTYSEAWYWKKLYFEEGEPEPRHVPGFHRVYSWSTGGALHTTLYHTRYFSEEQYLQALRITTTPSAAITYTPDSSKNDKFFQEVTNEKGEKEKQYAFQGFLPQKTLANRATLVLDCKLQNKIELKVQNKIDETAKKKKKQKNSRKIFLFKHLNVGAKYDFKAEKCHFTEGIDLHVASEAKMGNIGKIDVDWTSKFDPYLSQVTTLDNGNYQEEPIHAFAWNNGKYLGKVKTSRIKIGIQLEPTQNGQAKSEKKKALLDKDNLWSKLEEKQHKIDFETAWSIGCEFNWIYDRRYEYKPGEPNHKKEQYVTFHGSMTLVKKWKLSGSSTYNFTKKKLDPRTTEISIQRDLHCWQLSYQWYPLGDPAKYDFSLGVKANVLKVLKLPRKRSYNKLTTNPTNDLY